MKVIAPALQSKKNGTIHNRSNFQKCGGKYSILIKLTNFINSPSKFQKTIVSTLLFLSYRNTEDPYYSVSNNCENKKTNKRDCLLFGKNRKREILIRAFDYLELHRQLFVVKFLHKYIHEET